MKFTRRSIFGSSFAVLLAGRSLAATPATPATDKPAEEPARSPAESVPTNCRMRVYGTRQGGQEELIAVLPLFAAPASPGETHIEAVSLPVIRSPAEAYVLVGYEIFDSRNYLLYHERFPCPVRLCEGQQAMISGLKWSAT